MELAEVLEKVAIALGLGLLVGLQRERVHSPMGGIRTFALITLVGAFGALLSVRFGGWIVAAGALGAAALLVTTNLLQSQVKEEIDPGLTTEFAALLMYGVGAYVVIGHAAVAVAVGGAVAVLLHFKAPLHDFVARIGDADLRAIMQFVLIALVIWPVLPDATFDAYDVLNPHEIWLMVVLIVGISLGGYVAYKLFGQQAGAVLGGVLGGLISSTATTASYARRARQAPESVPLAALVIVIASTIAYARVLAEIVAVAPAVFELIWMPLGVMLAWMILISTALFFFSSGQRVEVPEPENPAELKTAILFGVLYAIAIFAVAAAKDYFGNQGLYVVALLSGIHDMDAITLSTARLVQQGVVAHGTGTQLIVLASLSNFVAKGGIVIALAPRALAWRIAAPFGAALAGGAAILAFWP